MTFILPRRARPASQDLSWLHKRNRWLAPEWMTMRESTLAVTLDATAPPPYEAIRLLLFDAIRMGLARVELTFA
jgi:hypothetical protein